MTPKNDDDGGIPKKVLDWLTAIGAIATILTAILSILPQNDEAKLWMFGVSVGLAFISIGMYLYQRRREARLKITESSEPLSASAALRGLLPFEEGDTLPGRGQDVQELFTLISSRSFRFGVLWGESGCGKTSLLRAGLVPKLRTEKFIPLYIHKPTHNPQEAIRSALLEAEPGLEKQNNKSLEQLLLLAAPKGKKIAVLFDQFEEFFLTNRTPRSRASFIKWLSESIANDNLPIVFMIGIRADFFAQLQNFAPQIPEPTSFRSTYQLQDFDTDQAKQIFSSAAKADGVPFEPELIQAVIRELESEEFIRPAELQIVGTRLKRKRVFSLNRYEALGGARGILSSYISDVIKQCPNEQTARLVLRIICPDTLETILQTDLSMQDILRQIDGEGSASQTPTRKAKEVQTILNLFVNARVLIHTDDDKYNLAHDYLAPYVRAATKGTETDTERANESLKRYVAEYKDDARLRIPFWRIRWIQKHASVEAKSAEKASQLIRKSRRAFYRLVSIPLILIAALYLFLASSYYFGVDEDNFIVILSGNPQWKFVPGFDQVVIQTDFGVDAKLDRKSESDIRNGLVGGLWFWNPQAGYQMWGWGEQLATKLEPISRARAFRLLGQPGQSAAVLLQIVAGLFEPNLSGADPELHAHALTALRLLADAYPEVVTSDMLTSLIESILDSGTDPVVRSNIASALRTLAQANPKAVTSDMLTSLIERSLDSGTDPVVRSNAVDTLGLLADAYPEVVTSDMLTSLIETIVDSSADPDVRSNTANTLRTLAQANPEAGTSEMLTSLIEIVRDSAADVDVRSSALDTIRWLVEASPEAVTPGMLTSLNEIVRDSTADLDVRSNAAYVLGSLAQANPEAVTPEMLISLIEIVRDTASDPDIRSNAASTIRWFARANPEAVTSEMLTSLIERIVDSSADPDVRFNAAYTLGLLGQANPEAVTSEMLTSLIEIVRDTAQAPDVRFNTAYALDLLARANLEAVTSEMLTSLIEIVRDTAQAPDVRSSAAYTLSLLAQANPEAGTSDMLTSLIEIRDSAADPDVRSNVVNALGSLAQANPEAVTSEMLTSLIEIILDSGTDPDLRSNAASTFDLLAQANPEVVTSDMLTSLIEIILNSQTDSDVRSNAADALSTLAQANPEVVTSDMLTSLIESVRETDPDLRSNAADALSTLAQANPEAVTSDMLTSLIESILDFDVDFDVRTRALDALDLLAQANLEAVTSEVLTSLIEIVRDTDSDPALRFNASLPLSLLAQANPEAGTSDMLTSLIETILDSGTDPDLRSNAQYILGLLAQANPEAVTSDMLTSLIETILNSQTDSDVRSNAASTFDLLAQANYEVVTSDMLTSLIESALDSDVDLGMRSSVVVPLGWIVRAQPEAVTSEMTRSLVTVLQSETDSPGRIIGGYILFLIDFQDIDREEIIRKELNILKTSPQPHLRTAAYQLLEMLAISDLIEEAHSQPEQIEHIKSRLDYLINLDDSIKEPLLRLAAGIVFPEVEKIEAGNK